VLHTLPMPSFFTCILYLYLAKSTSYEVPHCAVFSILLFLSSSVQILLPDLFGLCSSFNIRD
jgi:hypothetical protein